MRRAIETTLLTIAVSAIGFLISVPADAREFVGVASVIDGDTIDVDGQRIRLHGVDAPESAQLCETGGQVYRCGQQATNVLADLVGRRTVRCQQKDQDRYGRIVAVCVVGDENVNAWLVRRGHAVAYRKYSDEFVAQEAQARAERVGIWAGTL